VSLYRRGVSLYRRVASQPRVQVLSRVLHRAVGGGAGRTGTRLAYQVGGLQAARVALWGPQVYLE